MTFANPHAWHLLWLLPLIAAGLHWSYQHRCKVMSRFVDQQLMEEMAGGFSVKFYRWKAALLLAAFFFMVAALSRPQWGYTMRAVKRQGLDIMVTIDVSKSMLTQDVKPSRLERTKLAIKDLVMKSNSADHIGLIAFAGNAMLMCPLTHDYNGFLLSLDDLNVDSIPRGGTNIAQAIDEAVKAYQGKPDSDKVVILVTDGEEQEGDALQAARRAKDKGVRVYTVGVGTKEGDLIQVADENGQNVFFKDPSGNVVKSHLNENLLQQIAYITTGAYVHSGATHFGLDYLYDGQLSKLKKRDEKEKMARLYDERFQWPLTLAFIFLLADTIFLYRKRLSEQHNAALSKNIFLFSLFSVFIFLPVKGFGSVASDVNKANDLYHKGQWEDSLKLYEAALGQDQQSPVVNYNLGTALYKKGDYGKALKYLEQAAQDKNVSIKPKAEYNLGNVLYKSGIQKENTDARQAIKSLENALGHYGQALTVDPQDEDAKFNQDFVRKEIERLKKKQQQQQQQKQSQQQKQDQQKQQQDQQNQNQQNKEGQKNPQKEQEQQQQQKNQPSQAQDKKQQGGNGQAQKAPMSQQELDRREAESLLEDYKENEEPKKLLNFFPKKIDEKPVLKDW